MGRRGWVVVAAGLMAAPGWVPPVRASANPTSTAVPFTCAAAKTAGVPPEDAATAVDIVCRELASVSGSAGSFEVSLRPLGSSLVLTVSRRGAAEGRSLILDGFGEVPTAARRLADALVHAKPIEDTVRVDNLVVSEARPLVTRPGGRKFEMGVVGLEAGHGTGSGAGFSLGFLYDAPAFAIPAEMRWAGGGESEAHTALFSVDTGARYYFGRRDVGPFAGGGFSVLYLSYSESSYEEVTQGRSTYTTSHWVDDSRWGPGLYVEGGVQMFRTHRGRLTARVRADFPMYSLHPKGDEYRSPGRSTAIDRGPMYIVPVTFGITASF
jgi:hypothetical protein